MEPNFTEFQTTNTERKLNVTNAKKLPDGSQNVLY